MFSFLRLGKLESPFCDFWEKIEIKMCVCVCVCVCVCACTCANMRTYIHVCMHSCVLALLCVRMCVCVCLSVVCFNEFTHKKNKDFVCNTLLNFGR